MIRSLSLSAALLSAALLQISCSTGIDMPKGKRGTYQSARLVQIKPNPQATVTATEKQVHGMIQNSLARQFSSKGLAYGKSDADLVIAYLVIYQEPGMTALYDDYFGYGRDARHIADVAHIRGSIESKRPDFFRQAGILVDIIDARTGKLVFRNHAKGDVVRNSSPSTRAARIDQAVSQAISPFFQ